ncbi:MAG: AMP-binding protein [Caulobacterales bacterium]
MSASKSAPARADGPPADVSNVLSPADYPNTFAAKTPDRLALVFDKYSFTYAELDRACNAMVTLLGEEGVKSGDRVAYVGRNNDLYFVVMIACMRAGIVLVPVNWRNTAAETRYVFDDSGSKLIFADREFVPICQEADTQNRAMVVVDEDAFRDRLARTAPAPRAAFDPQGNSLQLYTSGTTGKPKGVLTKQFALAVQRHLEKVAPHFNDWQDDEILLSPLPSFHIGGLSWVMTGLCRGVTTHVTPDATPAGILDQCLAHNITRTFMVPTLVRALIGEMMSRDVRVKSLRAIHYGAAPMDAALVERSVGTLGCKFMHYFGMTEISGCVTTLGPDEHDVARPHLLRSVGRALPSFSIEIRGPDKELLKIDEPGEIWIKGPSVFTEYWNRPEATTEALIDGWYRSGDGGRLDADGYLYLTDRIKDMINSGGENVYPAEVEAVLRDHPAILDCAVFGLPHPKWGEGVTAAIELKPGQTTDADDVIAFARKSLAAYKIPRRIELGVTLPRTASGKVQRGAIRKHFLDKE